MPQREKFLLVDSEVRSFYEYCREAGMSDEEMDIICRPLSNAVRKAFIKRWTRVMLVIIMVLALGYTACTTETLRWHAEAATRMALIKLLPLWDWTPLYHTKCFIDRSRPVAVESSGMSSSDCITCEAISKFFLIFLEFLC